MGSMKVAETSEVADRATEGRLVGADVIRAAGCLIVFAYHAMQRAAPTALSPDGTVSHWFGMNVYLMGAFFVLSGYLLARPFWLALDHGRPMPSLRKYAIRRAARVLPGYWLALTVTFGLSWALLGYHPDREMVVPYLAGMSLVSEFHWFTRFPVHANLSLWSIGPEISSYALLPILVLALFRARLTRWRARLLCAGVIPLVVLAQYGVLALHLGSGWTGDPDSIIGQAAQTAPSFNPIAFFAIFCIGVLAAGVQTLIIGYSSLVCDGVALFGLGLAGCTIAHFYYSQVGAGLGEIPYGFPWMPLGVAIYLASAPGSVIIKKFIDRQPIPFMAQISYSIYIWHFLVMEIIARLWVHNYYYQAMTSVRAWVLTTAGALLATALVATASYYYMEAPLVRWARRLEPKPATTKRI